MNRMKYDVCVIGGGAAGIAAAKSANKEGAKVALIERAEELGGVLQQCIHSGFGLHHFHEELTGPEYVERVANEILGKGIDVFLSTVAVRITDSHEVQIVNEHDGYQIIVAKSVVVSIGCRERTRYQIDLQGKRLAGIMTAGHAQHYVNIDGYHVGKKVIILGSGDIGLIMARRLTLEGAKVLAVAELMPYSNGLKRNIVQCLQDFQIPLLLSHTVLSVEGENRLEKVILAEVDSQLKPIPGTEVTYDADLLLLSIGLIPENKLLRDIGVEIHPKTNGAIVDHHMRTSVPWLYACGNGLHVHDIVDDVSAEGELAGQCAAIDALESTSSPQQLIKVIAHSPIRYVVPDHLTKDYVRSVTLKFRVMHPLREVDVVVSQGDVVIKKIHKLALIPSEMEHIKLDTVMLVTDETINITIVEKTNE